jgi:hypothetical protein
MAGSLQENAQNQKLKEIFSHSMILSPKGSENRPLKNGLGLEK